MKQKLPEYKICPKCESELIFTERESICKCSNKKCDFGNIKLILVSK